MMNITIESNGGEPEAAILADAKNVNKYATWARAGAGSVERSQESKRAKDTTRAAKDTTRAAKETNIGSSIGEADNQDNATEQMMSSFWPIPQALFK